MMGAKTSVDVHGLSVDEALAAAGLDWEVEKRSLYFQDERPPGPFDPVFRPMLAVPNRTAIVRKDTQEVLGISSASDYFPVQNRQLFEGWREALERNDLALDRIGTYRKAGIFGLARVIQYNWADGQEDVSGWLGVLGSHNPGASTITFSMMTRPACTNVFPSVTGGVHCRQRHTSEFDPVLVKEYIRKTYDLVSEEVEAAEALRNIKLSMQHAVDVYRAVVAPEITGEELGEVYSGQGSHHRTLRQLIDSLNNAPGAEPGTAWGAFNGATHWATHKSGRDPGARALGAAMGRTGKVVAQIKERLLELA